MAQGHIFILNHLYRQSVLGLGPLVARRSKNKLARSVGRRIRELRNERGWDQVDLEAHLDEHVKRATLSDYETGRRMPSLETLARIAAAFEVEPATLLLNPGEDIRHRVAIAVLTCPDGTLAHVAKLLDVPTP